MLGPSGCGKTTILRLIAGFEQPTSGQILLEGADVSAIPPFRRNVNTVFQHYALFPHLNVYDNVAFGPRTAGLAAGEVDARVKKMLDVVRLGDRAQSRPDELSGGQRQRVALARALVNAPAALLLDEPLSALDAKLRGSMQIELKRIQREVGITFVFVTHDQEEALTLSDRIAVMSAGRIEQVGTPREIYDTPASVFVAGFIGAANLLDGTVDRVDGEWASLRLACGSEARGPLGGVALRVGDAAVVMVRPEEVKIAVVKPAAVENTLAATVEELIFQGPVLRCLLRDGRGREIVAHLDPDEKVPGLERGALAWASWEGADSRLLRHM